MRDKIIVYEKLSLLTLCFSMIAKFYFQKQYFIDFSPFIKRYLFKIVRNFKLEQIAEIDFLGKGFMARHSELILDFTEKILKENQNIVSPLIELGDDKRYIYVFKQILNYSLFEQAKIYLYTKLFSEKNETQQYKTIWFFPVSINNIFNYKEYKLPKISIIKFHYPLLKILNLISRLFYVLSFIVFPFYQFILWSKRGQIKLKKLNKEKIKKNILFDHRQTELFVSNPTRDMYLFRSNIINISECIHVTSFGKFSNKKISYLRDKGGLVTDYHNCEVESHYIINRLIIDYYTFILKHVLAITFNKYANFIFIKRYIGMIHYMFEFENFIKQIDVRLIFFENEQKDPFKVYSIIANKYGIKTMSLLHGFGPLMFPYVNRSNALFNYFLVPGMSYKFYLEQTSPGVDKFCPIGNHEIDNYNINSIDIKLLNKIKDKKRRFVIVGVFAAYYRPFFPEYQREPLFYTKAKTWKMFKKYWMPFFEWAGKKKDLFFIFKGKNGYKQYEYPYLKKALRLIPEKQYIQNDSFDIKDVIALSDIVVSTGNSSTNFASLSKGVPNVSLDVLLNGYNLKRYSEYIVAETGEELINNIEYILKNGLHKNLFDDINRDNYGTDGNIDGKTYLRIKELIEDIVNDENQ